MRSKFKGTRLDTIEASNHNILTPSLRKSSQRSVVCLQEKRIVMPQHSNPEQLLNEHLVLFAAA